jgi:hypothetical protein
MQERTKYMILWIDKSIHDFLLALRPSPSKEYALITCLDSDPDVESLVRTSKHLDYIRTKARPVGKGLMLPTRKLLDAERQGRIFFGFDEVWFSAKPITLPKPSGLVITGPDRPSAELIGKNKHWLDSTGCTLGLGDGTGMNCCLRVRVPSLVKRFITAVNESRETSDNTFVLG